MKKLLTFLATLLLFQYLVLCTTLAQYETKPGISIDEIIENSFIKGKVFGISPSEYNNLKVIIYVHTDKWYIHPYERGGKGKSYAEIERDGAWKIKTVKREFLADQVVALVVKKDHDPKTIVDNIDNIPALALIIEKETKDAL